METREQNIYNLSKFNDRLAIDAFSIANLKIMIENSKSSHLYYVLPFSLWGVVLHSRRLNLNTRKKLLEIIKQIFFFEYCQLEKNISRDFSEKFSKNVKRMTFYSKTKLKRIINTIVGLYYALERYPDNLS